MAEAVAKLPTQPQKIAVAFSLGERSIDGVIVKPLTFAALVECVLAAQTGTQPKTFESRLKRLRMVRQVSYFNGNTGVPISLEDIPNIPIPAARSIISHLDDDEGKAGKVVREGDGIDQAITYELGTPISTGQGKPPIKELEFHARTYGDIEDVMAADLALQQTAALITTVAKPLGTSLMLLPSWAVNMITVADGVTISREILPHFLGSPAE
jgi:hypothetical protein